MTLLCTAKTTDGSTAEIDWDGGVLQLAIDGVFDGATVALHVDQDGLGYQNLVGLEQTVPDVNRIFLKPCGFKCVISGAGASTSLTVSAI
jgi:hypothetical protein